MVGGTASVDMDTYLEFDFTRSYTFRRFVIEGIRDTTSDCQITSGGGTIDYCHSKNGREYSIEIGTETAPSSGSYTWTSCTAQSDLPFGTASSIVVGADTTTSNHVDVVCTGGTAGRKVRLRRQLSSAEMAAEGTNGNRIAIHAIAIMVDSCSQCDDIRYILP